MSVPVLLAAVWLVAVAAAARLAPRVNLTPLREAALALVIGAASAWIAHRWLAGWHLQEWPVLARDFVQVCDAVGAVRDGRWDGGLWPQRTAASAAPAGWLARRLGVVDGLRAAGALSLGAVSIGLYGWARSAHGAVAGAVAAALAGVVGPLAVFPRFLHVYPMLVATQVLAAAGGVMAASRRTPAAFLLAGTGAGLALLVDGRGLPFALAGLGAALLGLPRKAGPAAVRLAALVLPLALSFAVARRVVPVQTPTLETQLAWFLADVERAPPPRAQGGGFLWGHSDLRGVPGTLVAASELGGRARAAARQTAADAARVDAQVRPWLIPTGLAGLVALLGLRRRPRVALAVGVTAAPFALALGQAAATLPHVRLLSGGLVLVPLALGLAVGAAAGRDRGLLAAAVAAGLAVLALGGAIPSALHPGASWRTPLSETPDVGPLLAVSPEPWPRDLVSRLNDDPRCAAILETDLSAGHPWGGSGLTWPRR